MINPWFVVIWLKKAGSTNCRRLEELGAMTSAMSPPQGTYEAEPKVHRADVLVVRRVNQRVMPFAGP